MRRRSKKKKNSTHEGDLKQFLLMVVTLHFDFEGSYFMRKKLKVICSSSSPCLHINTPHLILLVLTLSVEE